MRKVCMLQLNVTDIEEAKRFYCGILGFTLKEDHGEILVFEHEGPALVVHKVTKSTRIDYPDMAQTLFVLEEPDIHGAIRRMSAQGVEFIQSEPIQATPGLYIGFRDPFGNVLELLQLAPLERRESIPS